MEADQVDGVAAAMPGDGEQVFDALESRFTREVVGDVGLCNLSDRVDDDVAFVHPVSIPHLDARGLPDADTALDSPSTDALAKALGELHREPRR